MTAIVAEAKDQHHAMRWWVLAIAGTAQLMVVLDSTTVSIALPSAQAALHFSTELCQWMVTAYALSLGSLLLVAGASAISAGGSGRSSAARPGSRSPLGSAGRRSPSGC